MMPSADNTFKVIKRRFSYGGNIQVNYQENGNKKSHGRMENCGDKNSAVLIDLLNDNFWK